MSSRTEHLIILLSLEELRLLPAADNTQRKEPKETSWRRRGKKKKKEESTCAVRQGRKKG